MHRIVRCGLLGLADLRGLAVNAVAIVYAVSQSHRNTVYDIRPEPIAIL